jgi:hypothetical protein
MLGTHAHQSDPEHGGAPVVRRKNVTTGTLSFIDKHSELKQEENNVVKMCECIQHGLKDTSPRPPAKAQACLLPQLNRSRYFVQTNEPIGSILPVVKTHHNK